MYKVLKGIKATKTNTIDKANRKDYLATISLQLSGAAEGVRRLCAGYGSRSSRWTNRAAIETRKNVSGIF